MKQLMAGEMCIRDRAEYEQLATAKRNAEQILHGTPSRQKKHEQER